MSSGTRSTGLVRGADSFFKHRVTLSPGRRQRRRLQSTPGHEVLRGLEDARLAGLLLLCDPRLHLMQSGLTAAGRAEPYRVGLLNGLRGDGYLTLGKWIVAQILPVDPQHLPQSRLP